MAKWFKYKNTEGTTTERLIIATGFCIDGQESDQAIDSTETVIVSTYTPSGLADYVTVYDETTSTLSDILLSTLINATPASKVRYSKVQESLVNKRALAELNATNDLQSQDILRRMTYYQRNAYDTYRDKLRTVNTQSNYPFSIVWPDTPSPVFPLADKSPYLYDVTFDSTDLNLITFFNRNTTALTVNARGYYQSIAVDTPRIYYDPYTRELQGVVVEGGATNLCKQSNAIGTTPWALTDATITANALKCPDKSNSGAKLIASATTSTHYVQQTITAAALSKCFTLIHAKAGEYTQIGISLISTGMTTAVLKVDLVDGSVISVSGGGEYYVRRHRNDWWEISFSCTTSTSSSVIYRVYPLSSGNDSFLGDGTSGIYVWGADLRVSSSPGILIPTTTTSVTTGADGLSSQLYEYFFDLDDFSIYVEGSWFGGSGINAGNRPLLSLDEANTTNHIKVTNLGGYPNGLLVVSSSSTTVSINGNQSTTSQGLTRGAYRISPNNVLACTDGVNETLDFIATLPTYTNPFIRFGRDYSGNYLNGIIRQVRFIASGQTDEQIQALTLP